MRNVLDSVVSALLEDKNRKFIYVEQVEVLHFFGSDAFLLIWDELGELLSGVLG